MSNLAITWALNQKAGSTSAKMVLFKLADQANDDGVCWPSMGTICWHTELSKSAVIRNIKKLESLRLLSVTRRKDGKVNLVNVYQLLSDTSGVTETLPSPTATLGGGVTETPKPSLLEPSINQSAIEGIYKMYPRKVGRPAAFKAIERAIKKHGEQKIYETTFEYAKARSGEDPQFTPHPATWYNQERFLDDPSTWRNTPKRDKFPHL